MIQDIQYQYIVMSYEIPRPQLWISQMKKTVLPVVMKVEEGCNRTGMFNYLRHFAFGITSLSMNVWLLI